jgi:hypothetical protein
MATTRLPPPVYNTNQTFLAGVQVQEMCDVIVSQPTAIMSTMDTLLRTNTEADTSNTTHSPRPSHTPCLGLKQTVLLTLLPLLLRLFSHNPLAPNTLSCGLTGAQVQVLCDVVASQPTVMMSTMDALLRANAVAEASNTIFYRRLQLYASPPGSHVPELLRLSQQAVITCTSM